MPASASAAVQVAAVRSAAYCSKTMKFDTGSIATKQIPGWKVSSSQTVTCFGAMPAARAARCSAATATSAVSKAAFSACCAPSLLPTNADRPLNSTNSLPSRVPPAARSVMVKCAANTHRCNQDTPSGVRINAVKAAGGSPRGTSRHQACSVLRGTPSSAATARCEAPVARRASAITTDAARFQRVRRCVPEGFTPAVTSPGGVSRPTGLKWVLAGSSNIFIQPSVSLHFQE